MTSNYNKDLYKVLEADYDASASEIKASYRRLARKYHPDAEGGDETKFKEIQAAYEILSNSIQRQKYDVVHGFYKERLKKAAEEKHRETDSKFNEYIKKAEKRGQKKSGSNEEGVSFSKSINDALDNLFHASEKQNKAASDNPLPVNGGDIYSDVTITAYEAIEGTVRKVNILHTEPCPFCRGRKFLNEAQCSVCCGTGQIQSQKKINVKIAKGVKQGSKIRVRKEGGKGLNGGKDGDLYLIVNIAKGKYIETDGTDIFITLPVSPVEAALGANVEIGILKEPVTVKIPPLTSSGQKLRLAGLGAENKSGEKGDIIITVLIKMPDKISEKEKALYEELKNCACFDARKDFNNAK